MKDNRIRMAVVVGTAICFIATFFNAAYKFMLMAYLSYKYNADFSDASSIGIIGGADGPTSNFVASSQTSYITLVFALLTMAGIIYLIIDKRKKDN